jgi:hypothetical protein
MIGVLTLISLFSDHALADEPLTKRPGAGQNDKAYPSDEEIRGKMKKYLGVPYKRAGASKKGFDCSGFVKVIYDEVFGVPLPHQSSQQSLYPELVDISLDSLRTGDLVFFSTSGKKRAINHVGIYISDGKFIHAARSQGVVVSELKEPYWRPKIVGAKRLAGRDYPVEAERTALDPALFWGRQNAVFFRYEKRKAFSWGVAGFENQSARPFAGNELHRTEFDYAKGLHPSLISHFTAFRETLYSSDEEKGLAPRPGLIHPDRYEKTGAYAQGVRLAGDLRPFGGLSVTPSLSYLEYGPSINETMLPRLLAGLNFEYVSPSDGWSLSTAMRMPLSRYPSPLVDENRDEPSMDISLTYRQRLSNHLQLSLSGEKFIGFVPGLRDSSTRFDKDDEKLTLMLHFFY